MLKVVRNVKNYRHVTWLAVLVVASALVVASSGSASAGNLPGTHSASADGVVGTLSTLPVSNASASAIASASAGNLPGTHSASADGVVGTLTEIPPGVSPLTATVCNVSDDLNGQLCYEIVGSRNYVSSMSVTQTVIDYNVTGHFEVTGPGGFFDNSTTVTVTPTVGWLWYLNFQRDVTPGSWCGIFWEKLGGNEYDLYDSACITVNPA